MNETARALLAKIESKDALVGIIGLGYVGLPLALAFAEKGFTVLGFDVDPARSTALGRGECYIKHLDGGRVAPRWRRGRLHGDRRLRAPRRARRDPDLRADAARPRSASPT